MSQQNVETMRASNEAWVAADFARLREMYDPGTVMRTAEDWPEAGPHLGREAVLRFLEELRDTWAAGDLEEISLIDAGDRILCRQRWHGVGRGPDAYLEVTTVMTFRNSKIVMIEYFWDHERALEAVGLSEQNDQPTALPTVPVDDKMRILDAIVEAVNAREVNEALLTDDFELVNVRNALTDKTYRGVSGAREWQHDFFDVLDENARFEITEIVEAGEDYLVVHNRLVGTASASGVPFDMEWFSAWWFRDGRLARGVGYGSRRAALAAVHGDAHADSVSLRDTARAMSQENVQIVRAVYERWSEGDFRAHLDLLDPHVVLVLGPDFPEAGMHSGIEAVAEYTRGLLEPWTHFTMEAEEIVGAGDSVLAGVCQRGVGSGSGVPTVLHYFTLWTFRGSKVVHLESFRERAEALEAAGLSDG